MPSNQSFDEFKVTMIAEHAALRYVVEHVAKVIYTICMGPQR